MRVILVREFLAKLHTLSWISCLIYLIAGIHLYFLYCLILVVIVASGGIIFINVNNCCLHDLVANTRVVEVNKI